MIARFHRCETHTVTHHGPTDLHSQQQSARAADMERDPGDPVLEIEQAGATRKGKAHLCRAVAMSPAALRAIDLRISEYALRLSTLKEGNGEESKRVKKRVLQKLGKLKKARAALGAGAAQTGGVKRKAEEGGCGDDDDSEEGSQEEEEEEEEEEEKEEEDRSSKRSKTDTASNNGAEAPAASRKKMKAKMKMINKELAQLAMKKQLKLSLKRLRQATNKGYEPYFDVHTFTNLINCYVRCGDNVGASSVLQDMRRLQVAPNAVTYTTILKGLCEAGDTVAASSLLSDGSWQPNLRAVNTFLRGCVRSGDVSLADRAFSRYFKQNDKSSLCADLTSFAYMAKLYCQSMQLEKATKAIEAAEALLSSGGDQSDESDFIALAGMHVDVAVALSLLGSAGPSDEHLGKARGLLECSSRCRLHKSMLKKMSSSRDDGEGQEGREDSSSMHLFRQHQRNELEMDIELLSGHNSERGGSRGAAFVAERLSRVFCFSSTEGDGADAYETTASALADSLVGRFGLHNVARLASGQGGGVKPDPDVLARNVVRALITSLDESSSHGTLRLGSRDVKLEICSGDGDWLVAQALADPKSTWVGLELRCDRVYRTFARSCLQNRSDNLVCIGGDASVIVKRHFEPGSVSAVFINHPEPPERTGGDADSQGGHLLTAPFFRDVHAAMKQGSGLSIVTDNLAYAKCLLQTVSQLSPLFRSGGAEELADSCVLEEAAGEGGCRVELWRLGGGEALSTLGHAASSSSYFDRLWARGKKKRRWALCVEKV